MSKGKNRKNEMNKADKQDREVRKELESISEKFQEEKVKQDLISAGLLPKPEMISYSDLLKKIRGE